MTMRTERKICPRCMGQKTVGIATGKTGPKNTLCPTCYGSGYVMMQTHK